MRLMFSSLHLIVNEKSPSSQDIKPAFVEKTDTSVSDATHYLIEKENLKDEYFWLYARYGNSLPHSDIVYNTKFEKKEENPRSLEQVEPANQLFCLYCTRTRTLYLSNVQKKNWLESYFNAKLQQSVVIKLFFKNFEEFSKIVKSINKIKLVSKRNLFTAKGEGVARIFSVVSDIFGLGMPANFKIDVSLGNAELTSKFKDTLSRLIKKKEESKIDSLVLIGKDDKNFETVYNTDSLIQKISVGVDRDEQGFYDPSEVRQALLKEIGGLDERNS